MGAIVRVKARRFAQAHQRHQDRSITTTSSATSEGDTCRPLGSQRHSSISTNAAASPTALHHQRALPPHKPSTMAQRATYYKSEVSKTPPSLALDHTAVIKAVKLTPVDGQGQRKDAQHRSIWLVRNTSNDKTDAEHQSTTSATVHKQDSALDTQFVLGRSANNSNSKTILAGHQDVVVRTQFPGDAPKKISIYLLSSLLDPLPFQLDSKVLSRAHVSIKVSDTQVLITDLGSTHGTTVQGPGPLATTRKLTPLREETLNERDTLILGTDVVREKTVHRALRYKISFLKGQQPPSNSQSSMQGSQKSTDSGSPIRDSSKPRNETASLTSVEEALKERWAKLDEVTEALKKTLSARLAAQNGSSTPKRSSAEPKSTTVTHLDRAARTTSSSPNRYGLTDAELLGEGTPAPTSAQPPSSVPESVSPVSPSRSSPIIDLTFEDDPIVSANSPHAHASSGAQEEEHPVLVDSIEAFDKEPEAGGNHEVQTSEPEQLDENDIQQMPGALAVADAEVTLGSAPEAADEVAPAADGIIEDSTQMSDAQVIAVDKETEVIEARDDEGHSDSDRDSNGDLDPDSSSNDDSDEADSLSAGHAVPLLPQGIAFDAEEAAEDTRDAYATSFCDLFEGGAEADQNEEDSWMGDFSIKNTSGSYRSADEPAAQLALGLEAAAASPRFMDLSDSSDSSDSDDDFSDGMPKTPAANKSGWYSDLLAEDYSDDEQRAFVQERARYWKGFREQYRQKHALADSVLGSVDPALVSHKKTTPQGATDQALPPSSEAEETNIPDHTASAGLSVSDVNAATGSKKRTIDDVEDEDKNESKESALAALRESVPDGSSTSSSPTATTPETEMSSSTAVNERPFKRLRRALTLAHPSLPHLPLPTLSLQTAKHVLVGAAVGSVATFVSLAALGASLEGA